MSFNAEFDAAWRAFYGGISGLLEAECGCQIVHGSKGDACVSLKCPNHGDSKKNSSGHYLHANDQKGAWKCFKCESEGNHTACKGYAVDAIMEYRHMDRKEAYKYICEKIGYKTNEKFEYSILDTRRMYATACHEIAVSKKDDPHYAEFYAYLEERFCPGKGKDFLIKEVMQRHRIGYCAGFAAVSALKKKGINDSSLEKAGILARSGKTGKLYPAFWGRVTMMTGHNLYGRAVDKSNTLRHFYTRSSNSVFNEMDLLNHEWDQIFVVESAFDAISIESYIKALSMKACVIATCGTQGIKVEEIIRLLKESAPAEIILVPDADDWKNAEGRRHAAGQKAGLKKARALEAAGFRVRIIVLDDGTDPNDLTKKGVEPAQFEEMFQRALSPAKYAIYCEAHYFAYRSPSGSVGFLNAVRKSLGKYRVPLTREILEYLSMLTGTDQEEIKRFMLPALKESDALDYIRSELAKGKTVDAVFSEIREKLAS